MCPARNWAASLHQILHLLGMWQICFNKWRGDFVQPKHFSAVPHHSPGLFSNAVNVIWICSVIFLQLLRCSVLHPMVCWRSVFRQKKQRKKGLTSLRLCIAPGNIKEKAVMHLQKRKKTIGEVVRRIRRVAIWKYCRFCAVSFVGMLQPNQLAQVQALVGYWTCYNSQKVSESTQFAHDCTLWSCHSFCPVCFTGEPST